MDYSVYICNANQKLYYHDGNGRYYIINRYSGVWGSRIGAPCQVEPQC